MSGQRLPHLPPFQIRAPPPIPAPRTGRSRVPPSPGHCPVLAVQRVGRAKFAKPSGERLRIPTGSEGMVPLPCVRGFFSLLAAGLSTLGRRAFPVQTRGRPFEFERCLLRGGRAFAFRRGVMVHFRNSSPTASPDYPACSFPIHVCRPHRTRMRLPLF